MKNVKLVLEYDGTDFFGWQKQKDLRTVQGVIESTLGEIFKQPVKIIGSGRTDAGVHAWGQVCNFKVDSDLEAIRIGRALASKLPDDIRVRAAQHVPEDYHARFSAVRRRYSERVVSSVRVYVAPKTSPLAASATTRAL